MMTLPRDRESIEEVYLLQWMLDNDIHKWIIAKETGNDGYKHWQVRMNTRYTFEALKQAFPKAHIEEASNDYEYEKKEGNYISSEDGIGVHSVRFGVLRPNQRRILDNLDSQNDRQIDVIVDSGLRGGNRGKSWLCNYIYERGIGFYVPPTCKSSQTIIQFIASGYGHERVIVIDIPRTVKWNDDLYVAIETVKDGLVYDTRYHTTIRNIRGVKVLVMCNHKPNVNKLSLDRWRLYNPDGEPLT